MLALGYQGHCAITLEYLSINLPLLVNHFITITAVIADLSHGPASLQLRLHKEPPALLLFSRLWIQVDFCWQLVAILVLLAEYVGAVSRLHIYNLISLTTANIDANTRVARRVQLEVGRLLASLAAQVPGLMAAHECAHTTVAARRLVRELLALLTVNVDAATSLAAGALKVGRVRRCRQLSVLGLMLVGCSAHLLITM